MSDPWIAAPPLDDAAFAHLRRRAIFDCCKWDPQVGDACVIARAPLVITKQAWNEVVRLAEALAAETLEAEAELIGRPELHKLLGVPRAVRRALRTVEASGRAEGIARLVRFDFHFTSDGWRISEANCDVPGGLNEASGFPPLVAAHYPWAAPVGDPSAAYVAALSRALEGRGTVALIHATAYSDDHQMMRFVARGLAEAGLATHLASPSHLRWRDARARLEAEWWSGPLDLIVRFFPADWLAGLPARTGWPHLYAGSHTPISNPAAALLAQSKRFPLVWDRMRTPLRTWRACLPETRDPRDTPWASSDEWVIKPTFGRAGEGIGMRGVTERTEMARINRSVRWFPGSWVAQRRFDPLPLDRYGESVFPCLGVYTLDARVIGAYGRVSRRPLIDGLAQDAAVLAA